MFKCVAPNGKVTYQGEKCATDAKMDAMLHRDGSRASAGEVAAAEAIEADRRKLEANAPKTGAERAPATKASARVATGERERAAYELADFCGEHAARASACGLDAASFQRKCHNRIHAITGGQREVTEPVARRMNAVSTGPSATRKYSRAECSAVKAELEKP